VSKTELEGRWALILGASSGFGAVTARALARAGMNIFGMHLDHRRGHPGRRRGNQCRLASGQMCEGMQPTGHFSI